MPSGTSPLDPGSAVDDQIEWVELHENTAFPMTGVDGTAISRGSSMPAAKCLPAGVDRLGKGLRHRRRVAGTCDRRIEQYGIEAEFHDRCGMGGSADAGIHDQRHIRKMRPHGAKGRKVERTPAADPIGAHQGISTLHPASSSRSATTRSSVV
jgi:hypothetical protein